MVSIPSPPPHPLKAPTSHISVSISEGEMCSMSMPDCVCADTYTCAVPVSQLLNTIAGMCKQSRRLVCCSGFCFVLFCFVLFFFVLFCFVFVFVLFFFVKNCDLYLQRVQIAGGGFRCKFRKATATSSSAFDVMVALTGSSLP